jgi:hypothetical protein
MERAQIRQIEGQRVESETEITGWEAEQILRKYGYENTNFSTREVQPEISQPGLTFDEMCRQEEERLRLERERMRAIQSGPKPTTFDGSRGYDSEVRYETDGDTGFGFKIEISTDMKLPKY